MFPIGSVGGKPLRMHPVKLLQTRPPEQLLMPPITQRPLMHSFAGQLSVPPHDVWSFFATVQLPEQSNTWQASQLCPSFGLHVRQTAFLQPNWQEGPLDHIPSALHV